MKIEDKSLKIRTIFSIMIGKPPNIFAIIVMGHLLIEHLLEEIIISKKNSKSLLKETFNQKLDSLYPTWIPLNIYKNIKILNKIRNDLVHDLGFRKYEPIIYSPSRKKIFIKAPKGKNPKIYYLRELVEQNLFELANYNLNTLAISENIDIDKLPWGKA